MRKYCQQSSKQREPIQKGELVRIKQAHEICAHEYKHGNLVKQKKLLILKSNF